jgi:hypothetical protein
MVSFKFRRTSISSEEFEDRKFSAVESKVALRGLDCDHSRMKYCCQLPCGHLSCPNCGLDWEEGAQK